MKDRAASILQRSLSAEAQVGRGAARTSTGAGPQAQSKVARETSPETLAQEIQRLVLDYYTAANGMPAKAEAWNRIASFAVSNVNEIAAALSAAAVPPRALSGEGGADE